MRVRDAMEALKLPPAIIVGDIRRRRCRGRKYAASAARVRGLVLVDAALGLTAINTHPPPALRRYGLLRAMLVSLFSPTRC